jgi:hypothetical protein
MARIKGAMVVENFKAFIFAMHKELRGGLLWNVKIENTRAGTVCLT